MLYNILFDIYDQRNVFSFNVNLFAHYNSCLCYCGRPKSSECRPSTVNANINIFAWRMSEIFIFRYIYYISLTPANVDFHPALMVNAEYFADLHFLLYILHAIKHHKCDVTFSHLLLNARLRLLCRIYYKFRSSNSAYIFRRTTLGSTLADSSDQSR